MKRNILLLFAYSVLILTGCEKEKTTEEAAVSTKETQQAIFEMDRLCSGDAKLADYDTVVTSVGGRLTFIKNGEIAKQYDDIHVNWLDIISQENLIVYSNWDKKVCILKFDEDFNIISNDTCMDIQEDLGIDPCICKVGSVYYITVTHITGTINNADINAENGKYTISLYKSESLKKWEKVSDVISADNNLEDVDLNFFDGSLYLTYEREQCDKGKSSINLLKSDDAGRTFGENIILVGENADNEPAGIFFENEKWYLFYSSDIENKGGTYEKANMYMQCYNSDFKLINQPVKLKCKYGAGTLFYDILWEKDNLYCLFAGNYLTENNLVLEKLYLNR